MAMRFFVLLILSLFASADVHAAQRVALVVGNSSYKHASELANPSNDARDMAGVLKERGFEVILGLDLDKAGFEARIRQFAQALKGADAGIFFYAGHGLQVSGQNFIVPVDAQLTDSEGLDFETIRLDVVQRIMEREAKASVLFLDACRNNPFTRSLARSLGTRSVEVGQGLAPVESGVGTLISYSTQPGNVALDGAGRNSPFAGALVQEIKKSHDDLSAMLIDVRNEVIRESNSKQVPWEHSALRARFFIAQPPPEAFPAAVVSGKLNATDEAWLKIKDSDDVGRLMAFRSKYGDKNPVYDQLARRRLESLVSKIPDTGSPPARSLDAEAARTLVRDIFKRVRADYPEPVNEAALVARGLPKLVDTFPGALDRSSLEVELARLNPSDVEGATDVMSEIFLIVQQRYARWNDPGVLMEGVLNPVLRGLDSLTTYLGPDRARAMSATTKGEFGGVGIEITLINGVLKIIAVLDDTPAARAGLRRNDIIQQIDGKTVQGLSLEEDVARLRGLVKTRVTLLVERSQNNEPIEITVERDTIKIVPVKWRLEGNAGYIKVSTFNGQTRRGIKTAIDELKKSAGAGLSGFVLDLRGNSGGLLDVAVLTADDFLEDGTIVSMKGRSADKSATKKATAGDIAEGKPIVLLTNNATASGAEIVVAALQENKRASVVGARTFGKGTIQTIYPMGERGAMRLTTSRFSTPNGRELETIGVAPDVVVDAPAGPPGGKDVQLEAALSRLSAVAANK